MIEIALAEITDFEPLGMLWQEFETRAEASFFQSWIWVGCQAAERFPDPIVLTVRNQEQLLALGLFNRRRQRFSRRSSLWLNESGDPRHDDIFVEHNGLLIRRDQPEAFITECLEAARAGSIGGQRTGSHRAIYLSGVGEGYLSAARRWCRTRILASRRAPFVDLEVLRTTHQTFLATVSSNTRYQIRRSERRYAALGPLKIERARSLDEAQGFLTGLVEFHQVYWTGRGKPGSFANRSFERFHRTLIARGFQRGAIDLLKVAAGTTVIGYLYNLSFRGYVYAYQSGFDYRLSIRHQKPGLTCHHLAIELYLAEGAKCYDFLGGDDQYKTSLASAATMLHWIKIDGSDRPTKLIDEV